MLSPQIYTSKTKSSLKGSVLAQIITLSRHWTVREWVGSIKLLQDDYDSGNLIFSKKIQINFQTPFKTKIFSFSYTISALDEYWIGSLFGYFKFQVPKLKQGGGL